MTPPRSILVIQTSFLGDVILATSVLETLHAQFPDAQIDMLVRKGNEELLKGHPFLRETLVWNKKDKKYGDLLRLMNRIRSSTYDVVVNLHRFASSGALAAYSDAPMKLGFRKNPMSMLYTHAAEHSFNGMHEIERNAGVIRPLIGDATISAPRLYPLADDERAVASMMGTVYHCIAPTSVWHTKQWPAEKWIALINGLPQAEQVYLLGAPGDKAQCEVIQEASVHPKVSVLAGELSLLQSAQLMRGSKMNYVNDSAPMHLASAVNAPVRVIYCSTVPEFGFGPLSDDRKVVQTAKPLDCRPCGLHGHTTCPKGHFDCALTIDVNEILKDA
ncbi:MAG: glycosyltransferase family 9 protein [Flavobacteriales bacterium]|nr:glycosyltransferase family 9 protein [Flavobacteriales bacterium]